MSDENGYIKPPPGLLPPPRTPEGVPERERIPTVSGGIPLFTPNPGPNHTTGPTIPSFRPPAGEEPGEAALETPATPPAVEDSGKAARLETRTAVQRPASVPAPSWSLTLTDGTALSLTGATYVGRNPSATGAAPQAALLPLADPAKSLSKTHALLVPELDYLMVTDLHSTNGIAVIAPGGAVTMLEPGRTSPIASGSQLQLGSFTVAVERTK